MEQNYSNRSAIELQQIRMIMYSKRMAPLEIVILELWTAESNSWADMILPRTQWLIDWAALPGSRSGSLTLQIEF
jgi:hypothetical protein